MTLAIRNEHRHVQAYACASMRRRRVQGRGLRARNLQHSSSPLTARGLIVLVLMGLFGYHRGAFHVEGHSTLISAI